MKKRLRFIVAAFSISFMLMAGLSFFSMERFEKFTNYSDLVDHTNLIINKLYAIDGYLKDIDRAERGYLLTHDTLYIRGMNKSIDSVYPATEKLKELTDDNPVQVQNIILLRSNLVMRIAAARQSIAYGDSSKSYAASPYYFTGRKTMQECSRGMKKMHLEENRLLSDRYKNEQFYEELTSSTIKYLLIIFGAVTIGLFIVMIREFRRRVRYQDELQLKVIDLKRSHAELEQIAYAASHDLQEPLRKIQVFANRILFLKKEKMDEDTLQSMERVNFAATRMQELIEGLVNLTNLTINEGNKQPVDLNIILNNVLNDLSIKTESANAIIHLQKMPVIKGYSGQLHILFKALIDNALKFTRLDVAPVISISAETGNGIELMDINMQLAQKKFNKITVSDNGIGFDNKFNEKMFQIFQRLHNQHSEYDGKGIGLAICQRIVANHEGYITAYGQPGLGASFKLFLPISE